MRILYHCFGLTISFRELMSVTDKKINKIYPMLNIFISDTMLLEETVYNFYLKLKYEDDITKITLYNFAKIDQLLPSIHITCLGEESKITFRVNFCEIHESN